MVGCGLLWGFERHGAGAGQELLGDSLEGVVFAEDRAVAAAHDGAFEFSDAVEDHGLSAQGGVLGFLDCEHGGGAVLGSR